MPGPRMPAKPLPTPPPPTLEQLLRSPVGAILEATTRRYVGWCWRKDGARWTKPPFRLSPSGQPLLTDVTNTGPWLELEAVWLGWRKGVFDGLGIVLLEDEPLRRIDLDGVRDPATGVISPPALEIVNALDSLTTISVSGTGLAIWTVGPPFGDQRKYKYARPDWPHIVRDKAPGIEVLNFACYSCVSTVLLER